MMNLLHRLANSVSGFFKTELEPWILNFLGGVIHAEANLAVAAAQAYVEQALPQLVAAAGSGDYAGFADHQAQIIKATAADLLNSGEKVGVTAITTAVTALIAGHPVVTAVVQPVQLNPAN